jgi:hypothetical protein
MQVIIYEQENGHVAICTPVIDSGLTVEQIAQKDVPENSRRRICETTSIPQNSVFFGAWIYDESVEGSPISIDVSHTHEIWKEEWRQARKPILARLDVEWMRALEQGNTSLSQDLADKKQTLRDVTLTQLPTREEGETVDQFSSRIKAIWPECLTW